MRDEANERERQWTIEAVRRDKKDKRRYLLFADGEEPILSVHEDILIRYRLMKGGSVSGREVEEIMAEDDRYRAYALAVSYLGAKSRTRKQIGQYLARKELEERHIQYALDRLEAERLVDDRQYAKQFAASRLESGLKGRLMIRQELQQRGVSKTAAAEALSALDRESEMKAAKTLAMKKSRLLKGDGRQRKAKLMAFLLRRGFPGAVVKEAVKSVHGDEPDGLEAEDDGVWLDN